MRVLFCGGGTAGHVNPALAVAQTVLRNSCENRVAYVTTLKGIENELVEFKKYPIDVSGLKKGLSFKNISILFKQMRAIERCKEIIHEFRPDIIFGTGGYATFPVVVAGNRLGIKTVVHESNALPGKAIKHLEKKVDRVFVNFEESKEYFNCKSKIVHTGNPLRKSIEISKSDARKELDIIHKFVVVCTSGSLGSQRVNSAAISLIENLICNRKDILFIWSTGKNEYERAYSELKKRRLESLDNVIICDYYQSLPTILSSADLVISRAGAMTISELAYLNKASILVPSPNVANNHQYVNARALELSGAAIIITEDRLYTLTDTVKELLSNENMRLTLENNIGKYAISDANKIIYNQLTELVCH